MVRHAVLQLAPEKGQITRNLERLGQALEAIAEDRPDVVALPEAYPTAYFLQGGVRELAMTAAELEERLSELHARVWEGPLDLVIGFYELDEESGDYYNTAAYFELGGRGLIHRHRKVFLPTYGVFDEERYLSRGHAVQAFETRFGKAAILICEDFWHSITATIAALDGAEVIYVPSASPARGFDQARPQNARRWRALAESVAGEHGLYVVLASLVGFEAGKGMSGYSLVASPEGKILAEAPGFEEAALVVDLDFERIPPIRYENPLLADLKTGLGLLWNDLERVKERL